MKVKLFLQTPQEDHIDFENRINSFISNVEVVDIRLDMSETEYRTYMYVLVLYK